MELIKFNKPYISKSAEFNIHEVIKNNHLRGDGYFSKKCQEWLENFLKAKKVLLTHSCTAALEMSAMLVDIREGDEVILPSYTFVSSANAFVLRGAKPIFVDVNPFTLNIDEKDIISKITNKTKAILVVHYAGSSCDMKKVTNIAKKKNIYIIEDAAQSLISYYEKRPLGSIGDLGCLSFHETKNIQSGEGGALIINNSKLIERAEILREKGTNRVQFFQGKVDKYSWVDIGSSYLPSELIGAFLYSQLEESIEITKNRLDTWNLYYENFKNIKKENFYIQKIPSFNKINGHIFFMILPNSKYRNDFIRILYKKGIESTFHYIPLHNSPYYMKKFRSPPILKNTESLYKRIVRLPIWSSRDLPVQKIIKSTIEVFAELNFL